MKKNKSTPISVWLLVVVIVLIVVIVFVASFGTFDVKKQLPQEFKDSKEAAIKKHKALTAELDKKKALKKKLEIRFRNSYQAARISLVVICCTLVYLIGNRLGAQSLGEFLNYYQASIIFLFAMNFMAFGTVANFRQFIYFLRTRVENWVYGKHLSLPKEIKLVTTEIETLENKISIQPIALTQEQAPLQQ